MSDNRDYTGFSFKITFLVVAILLVISLIPPFSIGNVNFRRANILSDIITFNDPVVDREGGLSEEDRHFLEEAERLGLTDLPDVAEDKPEERPTDEDWDLGLGGDERAGGDDSVAGDGEQTGDIDPRTIVKFEDYTAAGKPSVADFSHMMEDASKRRVVRIAFLGDSYIEGDIITADVREQLQNRYGGHGVGFVPFGNPLAISRPTVKHTFANWTNLNLIYKKDAPDQYKDRFFVSGTLNVPQEEGAWSKFEGVGFRKNLYSWSRAKLIFVNTDAIQIDVTVNDSIRRRFTPQASEQVQQINLTGAGMRSVKVDVNGDPGFMGYGMVLEGGRGVTVDNYAIRSNSGLAMFGTDSKTNQQIGRMLGYDMVVLQWGLNAMSPPDATDFKAYGQSLRRVINYMKNCFPNAAIVVMGVGDRATQENGEFVTMPAVKAMVAEQRAAAKACEVAFWDTFRAMGGENSMSRFVEGNMAAKDYTHLSYGGGRKIAGEFIKALHYARRQKAAGEAGFAGDAAIRGEAMPIDVNAAVGRADSLEAAVNRMDSLEVPVNAADTLEAGSPDAAGQDEGAAEEIQAADSVASQNGISGGEGGDSGSGEGQADTLNVHLPVTENSDGATGADPAKEDESAEGEKTGGGNGNSNSNSNSDDNDDRKGNDKGGEGSALTERMI